jgi:hypothetical protein
MIKVINKSTHLLIITLVCLLIGTSIFAQAPQKMSYQAVIRNTSGALVTSTTVGMKISILQGTVTGTVVYAETQNASTNANGLVSVEIGSGTIIIGTFSGINWGNGPYFIKTQTDPTGGTNYTIASSSQLMSVPYALFSANGTPGPQGPTGLTGLTGSVGAIGPQGPIGLTGAVGATGPQGPIGLTGAVGATGPQGPIGLTGAVGATGVQGPIGLTGSQGPIGLTGSQGPIGLTGAVGATGAQGPIGLTGAVGSTGPQGPIGLTGAVGAQGIAGTNGNDGATGPTGPTGLTGAVGATGAQGPIGLTGAVGSTGPQGPIGLTGAVGAQGIAGTNGNDGATGAQGPIGLTGAVGATGAQGIQGVAGTNGTDGKNTLAKTTTEAAGANCTTGGVKIEYGLDANNNGTLDVSEINASLTKYVCNGAVGATGATGAQGVLGANGTNGTNGLNALIKTTTEPAGANCTNGGTKIETGLDANANSVLDASEVNASQTQYLCNGGGSINVSGSGQGFNSNHGLMNILSDTILVANQSKLVEVILRGGNGGSGGYSGSICPGGSGGWGGGSRGTGAGIRFLLNVATGDTLDIKKGIDGLNGCSTCIYTGLCNCCYAGQSGTAGTSSKISINSLTSSNFIFEAHGGAEGGAQWGSLGGSGANGSLITGNQYNSVGAFILESNLNGQGAAVILRW